MKWKDKLKEWLKETPLKYPKNIKLPFFWETKCLNVGTKSRDPNITKTPTTLNTIRSLSVLSTINT